jgi:protoheme IX farnesyltransferase
MSMPSSLAFEVRPVTWWSYLADYLELTKPKIATLVLVTVAVAAVLAAGQAPAPLLLMHTLLGTALVAASASAFNQWIERDVDARMPRTADRPLPAGRLANWQVLSFGAVTVIAGLVYLTLVVNRLTALMGFFTWLSYVCVYTPLKTRTPANTAVGAVAGALPVFIGWTAVGAPLDTKAFGLFLLVYLWQFPHFMAIAWLYRHQYAAAGMQMLTVVDPSGRRPGAQAVVSALAILPVSLVSVLHTHFGLWFGGLLLALGTAQLLCAVLFLASPDEHSARRLLRASLVYLPTTLAALTVGPVAAWQW